MSCVRPRIWPLALALLLFLAAAGVNLALILRVTHGSQLFVLDDAYIHAAIARNLLLHHVYAPSPGPFAPAASSILWPYLLAAVFAVFGMHMWLLLALNLLLALGALWLCHRIWVTLAPEGDPAYELVALLAIVFAGSLLSVAFMGMEHVLQFVTVAAWLFAVVRIADRERSVPLPAAMPLLLCVAGVLAVLTRFEGALAVAVGCSFLFLCGRRGLAVCAAAVSALPILIFGCYSIHSGGSFFPNPLLIKAVHDRPSFLPLRNLFGGYPLVYGLSFVLVLTAALLLVAARRFPGGWRHPAVRFAGLSLVLAVVHCCAGQVGWAYRYEAYLMDLGFLAIAVLAALLVKESRAAGRAPALWLRPAGLQVLIAVGCSVRIVSANTLIANNAHYVYDQQLQTARFLARYYGDVPVAVNDIGAVSFLHNAQVVDLWGLGTTAITRDMMKRHWNAAVIDEETRAAGVQVVAIYPHWFDEGRKIPSRWVPVAAWTVPPRPYVHLGRLSFGIPATYLGSDRVVFYATDPALAPALARNLSAFATETPAEVTKTLLWKPDAPSAVQIPASPDEGR